MRLRNQDASEYIWLKNDSTADIKIPKLNIIGDIYHEGNTEQKGDFDQTGNYTLQGNFDQTGNYTLQGNFDQTGAYDITGNITAVGTITGANIAATAGITGASIAAAGALTAGGVQVSVTGHTHEAGTYTAPNGLVTGTSAPAA